MRVIIPLLTVLLAPLIFSVVFAGPVQDESENNPAPQTEPFNNDWNNTQERDRENRNRQQEIKRKEKREFEARERKRRRQERGISR